MPYTPPVPPEKLAEYPKMTNWFGVGLLAKLVGRVILSDWFGQYADRRLMVAALDADAKDKQQQLAKQFLPGAIDSPGGISFTPDQDGNVWFDFVADLGDGFDATYAIASLLAQETLEVDGHKTKRGQLLLMGGDEVYPLASPDNYQRRLRDPYAWAFPDPYPARDDKRGVPIYAIPGNHDWYDGLQVFLALFCRKSESLHPGGWRTFQHRSYFALQLTSDWWVWAMDAQLDDDVDQPQKEYFLNIAEAMGRGAKVILIGPEPGWLYLKDGKSKSLDILSYVGLLGCNHCKDMSIPLILSGDTHHYSRYIGDGPTKAQFITSGGGGAFLHPTHHVRQTATIHEPKKWPGRSWLDGKADKELTLASKVQNSKEEALYPSRKESLELLKGNFCFPTLSPGFSLLLGAFYLFAVMIAALFPIDAYYVVPFIFVLGFMGYTFKQEGTGAKIAIVASINGLIHSILAYLVWDAALCLSNQIDQLFSMNSTHSFSDFYIRVKWVGISTGIVAIGGFIGSFLYGVYLYASSRWLDMNQ